MKTTPTAEFKAFVLYSISLEGYGVENSPEELKKVFKSEYGHMIERVGERKAFEEYMLGAPSSMATPFYYHEITPLMYAMGQISKEEHEANEYHEISALYFKLIAQVFYPVVELV